MPQTIKKQSAGTVQAPAKKTIMVVDDEPDILVTVKTVLESNGYNVVTAINGDDCLKKLPGKNVDLILMDIMMPGTPVKQVVGQISGVKIAYLSVVRTSEAEKEELLTTANVVDFIQKPFDLENLLKRVKKLVG